MKGDWEKNEKMNNGKEGMDKREKNELWSHYVKQGEE